MTYRDGDIKMDKHGTSTHRGRWLARLPLIAIVAALQCGTEYYLWAHKLATAGLVLAPIVAWPMFFRILRLPPSKSLSLSLPQSRWIATGLTFVAWWAGAVWAVNTFGE
jgi:hypothetical protein